AMMRVRRDGPRPLSATEQRWIVEQLRHRPTSEREAATGVATSKEASSMIGRPRSTATESIAAGATGSGSMPVDPTVNPIVPPRFPERGPTPSPEATQATDPGREAGTTPPRLGEGEPEGTATSAASAATPRLADRPAASAGRRPARSATRSAHRAAPDVESAQYRVVFACSCVQARDAPTTQSTS